MKLLARSWLLACALLLVSLGRGPATFDCAKVLAQEGTGTAADDGKDAAESRATAFQAVEGPQKEQVPGGALLVSAYAFVLVLLVAYVWRLGALQSKTAAEVERLMRALDRGKSK